MKRNIRIALYALAGFAVLAGIIWANITRNNSLIRDIDVEIAYNGNDTLVTAQELQDQLIAAMPDIPASLVKDIDADRVAEIISSSPYILSARSNVSVGRVLVVNAIQRRPILRIFYGSREFYLDDQGRCIPLSLHGDPDVMVGNGNFRQNLTEKYLEMDLQEMASDSARCRFDLVRMWKAACYLDKEKKYNGFFDQIYIGPEGDLELTPKVGNHTVVIGDPDEMDRKMSNLWAMYQRGMEQAGWNTYKKINLKYGDQVICTKRR